MTRKIVHLIVRHCYIQYFLTRPFPCKNSSDMLSSVKKKLSCAFESGGGGGAARVVIPKRAKKSR